MYKGGIKYRVIIEGKLLNFPFIFDVFGYFLDLQKVFIFAIYFTSIVD